ncbi:MAG: hypothetical protein H5U10_18070 [Desulfacinum sp.]|jgi:hypothetical protein|nr:hypothetical protein [Desulfacinum sp.]
MDESLKEMPQLLADLREEVGRWEDSPYHLAEEDLFDLERFLEDRGRKDLARRLESVHGRPLNRAFWGRLLPYRRLRKARALLQEREEERKKERARYLRAFLEYQEELGLFLERLREEAPPRPPRLRIVPKETSPEDG